MADQKRVVYEYLEALLADPAAGSDELLNEQGAEQKQLEENAVLPEGELFSEETVADPGLVTEAIVEPEEPEEPEVPESAASEPEPVHEEQSIADEWPEEPYVDVVKDQSVQPSVSGADDLYAQEYESMMKCVLVRVQGLSLAIPVDYIDGAVHITTISMSIEMNHDWILGRFGPQHDRTTVVDTARWVIPDTYSLEKSSYSDIIILSGRDWALACDELVKSINIPRSAINFNANKEARAWLLGTYMPERCAILDIDQLVDEFELMII
ncbi:chemotaxis protein CheW [Nitrincola alkalilacustris]|uniref:chemotaxis protein CheW n=1 Tax=Nitrincola alkalilacustris TaxID=1571224 RepID=UPI00124F15AE|nr:chemotaxis protein CheW [Nitrincola alkalilacustris]